jgi:predicted DNA-binding protein
MSSPRSRRPGFPHRVTLDLTEKQYATLTAAVDQAGGSMADYVRAIIEMYEGEGEEFAARTEKHLREMRAQQRSARRARRSQSATSDRELKVA